MKKFSLIAMGFLIILATSGSPIVIASVITEAIYAGTIRITNSGATASNVFTTVNISTQDLIDSGYIFESCNNTAMLTNAGADTAYMPAQENNNRWVFHVPTIGVNGILDYPLYTGGTTDMSAKLAWFPGLIGGNVTDSATLELSDNFTITQSGYVDTDLIDVEDNSYEGSLDGSHSIFGVNWYAQTFNFTASSDLAITSVEVYSTRALAPGTINASIRATAGNLPTGDDLVKATANASMWQTANTWHKIYFPSYILSPNVEYSIVLGIPGGDAGNKVNWVVDDTAPAYSNGQAASSGDSGSTWGPLAKDFFFRVNFDRELISKKDAFTTYISGTANITSQVEGTSANVTASGISSGEMTVTTATGNVTGNELTFDGTANSQVNCGVINNASAKFWVSFRFKLDNSHAAGGQEQMLVGKWNGTWNNAWRVYLSGGAGTISFRQTAGGVDDFWINTVQNSWQADRWYWVLASISDVNGARLRVEEAVAVTDADLSGLPNGGRFIIGNIYSGYVEGLIGEITDVIIGTDDLLVAEENDLWNGIPPGDETDYWAIDEGTGTAIASYGSASNNGTADTAITWALGATGKPFTYSILIDGTLTNAEASRSMRGAVDVLDNANDYIVARNSAMPYMEYLTMTINGTQQANIRWENADTFTDLSGNSHDLTPSFRNATSDADVTAVLLSFRPITQSQASGWSVTATPTVVTSANQTGNLTGELNLTGIPGAPMVNEVLDENNLPRAIFWFPAVFLVTVVIGLFVGKFSLIAQVIVMTTMIGLASGAVVAPWLAVVFMVDSLAVVVITGRLQN